MDQKQGRPVEDRPPATKVGIAAPHRESRRAKHEQRPSKRRDHRHTSFTRPRPSRDRRGERKQDTSAARPVLAKQSTMAPSGDAAPTPPPPPLTPEKSLSKKHLCRKRLASSPRRTLPGTYFITNSLSLARHSTLPAKGKVSFATPS